MSVQSSSILQPYAACLGENRAPQDPPPSSRLAPKGKDKSTSILALFEKIERHYFLKLQMHTAKSTGWDYALSYV
jgi:hypothetical protein